MLFYWLIRVIILHIHGQLNPCNTYLPIWIFLWSFIWFVLHVPFHGYPIPVLVVLFAPLCHMPPVLFPTYQIVYILRLL